MLTTSANNARWRVLLCHKHPVSARLRFLVPSNGGVCLPWHLPGLSVLAEDAAGLVDVHPSLMLPVLAELLSLPLARLFVVPGFGVVLEQPGGLMPVYLASLEGNDVPEAPVGLRWIELPDSIPMPWLDRELLRRAYEFLIG